MKKAINEAAKRFGISLSLCVMLFFLELPHAFGQVEVIEGESTIVPSERYSSDEYFDKIADRQSSLTPTNEALSLAASDTDILMQIQSLQAELRQLRGVVEEQRHAIETLDRQRMDDYLDLDHRLSVSQQAQIETAPAPSEDGLNFSFVPLVASQSVNKPLKDIESSLSSDEEAKQSYRQAYQLVKDREFERAQVSLASFIERYPSSSYKPNAYFWLGELQYLAMELSSSRDSFLQLIKQYPQHKKVADAKFKLGKIYHQLGHSEKARNMLTSVVRDHAGSTAANPAREYLNSNLR